MKRIIIPFLIVIALLAFQPIGAASAATITVNALDDTDDGSCDMAHCSLREAINYATAGDTIYFSVTGTISLNSTELNIDKDLNIQGPGASFLTVSANPAPNRNFRVLSISTGDISIYGITMTNGDAKNSSGGGIYIHNTATLTVTDVNISNNTAKYGGGAIANMGGSVTIINSTIADSESENGSGGGIYNHTNGSLDIKNSTVSGNLAKESGGGIYNIASASVSNSTISGNSSSGGAGGGVYNHTGSTISIDNSSFSGNAAKNNAGGIVNLGTLNLKNSIVANSTILPQNNPGEDCYAHVTSTVNDQGYNLIEYSTDACGLVHETNNNIVGLDPNLDTLSTNGGPAATHALIEPSPALDIIPEGTNGCGSETATDQRGASRPYNANCDIGAYEYRSTDTACEISGPGIHVFGNIAIEVVSESDIECLSVEEMGTDHLAARGPGPNGGTLRNGNWWYIEAWSDNVGGNQATTFEINLTLPDLGTTSPLVCKYPGDRGGYGWNCDTPSRIEPGTVTLNGITELSDWTIGDNVGPTAVNLQSFNARSAGGANQGTLFLEGTAFLTGLLLLGALFVWKQRNFGSFL